MISSVQLNTWLGCVDFYTASRIWLCYPLQKRKLIKNIVESEMGYETALGVLLVQAFQEIVTVLSFYQVEVYCQYVDKLDCLLQVGYFA